MVAMGDGSRRGRTRVLVGPTGSQAELKRVKSHQLSSCGQHGQECEPRNDNGGATSVRQEGLFRHAQSLCSSGKLREERSASSFFWGGGGGRARHWNVKNLLDLTLCHAVGQSLEP